MQSKLVDHIIGLTLVAIIFYVRLVTQAELSGDLLLITLIVFAWYADAPLMATLLGASALVLSLYPGFLGATILTILLPLAVFALHNIGVLARLRTWMANIAFSILGVLIFHAILHPRVFMFAATDIMKGTAYALVYSVILFGILREIYVRKER